MFNIGDKLPFTGANDGTIDGEGRLQSMARTRKGQQCEIYVLDDRNKIVDKRPFTVPQTGRIDTNVTAHKGKRFIILFPFSNRG